MIAKSIFVPKTPRVVGIMSKGKVRRMQGRSRRWMSGMR